MSEYLARGTGSRKGTVRIAHRYQTPTRIGSDRLFKRLPSALHNADVAVLLDMGSLPLKAIEELTDLLSVVRIELVVLRRLLAEARGAGCARLAVEVVGVVRLAGRRRLRESLCDAPLPCVQ